MLVVTSVPDSSSLLCTKSPRLLKQQGGRRHRVEALGAFDVRRQRRARVHRPARRMPHHHVLSRCTVIAVVCFPQRALASPRRRQTDQWAAGGSERRAQRFQHVRIAVSRIFVGSPESDLITYRRRQCQTAQPWHRLPATPGREPPVGERVVLARTNHVRLNTEKLSGATLHRRPEADGMLAVRTVHLEISDAVAYPRPSASAEPACLRSWWSRQ